MKKSMLKKKQARWGWLFISPFVIGFALIYSQVFLQSIMYSFQSFSTNENGFLQTFVGLGNYRNILFENTEFNKTIINSLTTSLVNVPIIVIFSLFIAVLLNQKFRGRAMYRAIFFIPVILATGIIAKAEANNAITSTMWNISSIDSGSASSGMSLINSLDIQQFLIRINLNSQFTEYIVGAANNIYNIINLSGVQILVFLAGLQSISPSIYESAKVEGATGWETFWKITFPIVSPLIFLNFIYGIIDSFTNSQNKLITLIYDTGIKRGRFGIATTMAWIYTAAISIILLIVVFITSRYIRINQNSKRR